MKFKITACIFLLTLFSFKKPANDEIKPARLLLQMFDSIRNVKTQRNKIYAVERVENKFLSASSEVKIQTSPRKVYFINRERKLEILYDAEKSPNKVHVKMHVFPYFSLMLDPRGNMMRKNQHYTVHELGFEFISRSVAFTIFKDKKGVDNYSYLGKARKNGYMCHVLEYENNSFSFVDYIVQEKETVSLIAAKLSVNDYLLRHRNNLLNEFGYIRKGTRLSVPTLYCRKALILLDERMMLPVSVSLYDQEGLFESYDFSEIVINKPFKHDEFSKEFEAYGF